MSFLPTSRSGKKGSLPVSTKTKLGDAADAVAAGGGFIRRRLSTSSLKNNTSTETTNNKWSSFIPRSKSLSFSSIGDSIRNWWTWSWAWILSRKPIFATDLEMNEQETKLLTSRDKGSWKHVICRMRSEIRRRITNSDHYYTPLPQTMAYTK
ncbi:hypothetical protein MtrunA17_Chr5g0448731 [Medicago truncatula]|uniref:Uncharacterized protein n=1 Tax=Medicago truncatula TaxID=3880 RepID=G7KFG9_MEDTR|nr:uncharacterized protein LOC11421787 [Medicago truncatula]AET01086.1 hypothetical protein MTR_5g099250 [Medicago truncatula]AFK34886.1 unknown [Medicago truncatula]RHN58217.1 hypothetical protein MtrunA17_Chr5g0448731 [Medicago truncatula]